MEGGKAICLKEFNEGKYSGERRGGGGKPVYMENWRNNVRWDIWAHLFLG